MIRQKTKEKPRCYAYIRKSFSHGEKARKNILKLCKEDPLIMIFQELPCHKEDHLLPGMDLMLFFSCSKFDHKAMDCRIHGRISVGIPQ